MKPILKVRSIVIEVIALLYMMLFVYAAVSKLRDMEIFRIQLGQSPMLSAFADIAAWTLPVIELVIAGMLIFPKTKFTGLYTGMGLMTMFTTYIIVILNFSMFIPCSCGGILSEMDWEEHLLFNVGFVLIAVVAILLAEHERKQNMVNRLTCTNVAFRLAGTAASATVVVAGLYFLSEHEIHRNNGFIRRYPHHPVTTLRGIRINFNSYYIAGFADQNIYLGNVTAPLHLLRTDSSLRKPTAMNIRLPSSSYTFSSVQVRIQEPYFFVYDGTVPIIYRGKLKEMSAFTYVAGSHYFSYLEPIDTSRFAFRSMAPVTNKHVLGILNADNQRVTIFPEALKGENAFDTDGIFSFNQDIGLAVYTFFYRNEYVIGDDALKAIQTLKTIDTTNHSTIELAHARSKGVTKLAKAPIKLQMYSTTAGRYLFVKSDRLGRYEPEEMLEDASIIDVYDLLKHTYEFSFYLYDYEQEKVKSFKVNGDRLYGLTDHYLVSYKMSHTYFDFSKRR
ncbi:MAG TPA: MauE/DoxX family redox-associated membrane protein [Flavobacterium sp.]|jgi:uncharacterized membrane protein YphA (DoxX/SURF4 family)